MKRELALLLALCAFAAAMVPRERRAVDSETQTPATEAPLICAPSTPCGWSFYKTYSKIIDKDVINTYCICAEGTTCQIYEDDESVNSYVKRCKTPSADGEKSET